LETTIPKNNDYTSPAPTSPPLKGLKPNGRYTSQVIGVERRGSGNTVFQVDDSIFVSASPRPTHWSIAWSDLMMTMFILFLSMFTYQVANEKFLKKGGQEIIGGDTTEALQTLDSGGASLPFPTINPGLHLMTSGSIKMIDPVPAPPVETLPPVPPSPEPKIIRIPGTITVLEKAPEQISTITQKDERDDDKMNNIEITTDTKQSLPPLITESAQLPSTKETFQELYALGQDALESNNLEKFATIDLVPDKTVRIILTGDLLFDLGESDLTPKAQKSLYKVINAIRKTPYMINVVGHTDNIPMSSERFKSNWELSVARASTVTRFLINGIGMNPAQFVVSGFASYRPTVPNNSVANRAKNRRVEIIISKRLPNPQPVTTDNLD
jgi:chemotaxis protein MotB